MDVSIGHLHLAGRVVGSRDGDRTARVVDLLTGPSARDQLLTALTSAFDGDEVLLIRSIACTATLRADVRTAPPGLAGSIAASAARLLRDHPADDDCVVRFADVATYVAAYVLDCLDGQAHRWYYDAFEPFRRKDGSTDLAALLAAHRSIQWRILAKVRRQGDLETLLNVLGSRSVDLVTWSDYNGAAWSALVTTASAIVRAALGRSQPVDEGATTALARAEPPPDWRDSASLGRAVAAAVSALLPPASRSDEETLDRLLVAARDHDWFDPEAFAAGLLARRGGTREAAEDALTSVLSPRAREVLSDLTDVVADAHFRLDPRQPASPANLVRLISALVQHAPQWDDDELARAVAAHVLNRWQSGGRATTGESPPLSTPDRSRAPLPSTRLVGAPPRAHSSGIPDLAAVSGESPATRTPATPVEVARLLEARFPRPAMLGDAAASSMAGGLLLLRALLDLGLSRYLPGRVGLDDEPLLTALLRRWSGAPIRDDPVLTAVLAAAGEPVQSGQLGEPCALAARRLVGLRLVTEPVHLVSVPHGRAGVTTIALDDVGHLLPSIPVAADVDLAAEPSDPSERGTLADALSAVSVGHDGPDDLLLDLLAVSCIQAWARWLPGFSGASVPFLLATFIRRPATVTVNGGELTVHLPPRSHDVVLELAGYVEPLDPGPLLGGLRVRFVSGDGHGS